MHISLVQASVKQDLGQRLEKIYNDTILKTLGKTPGCIFAGLLLSLDQNRQYIALTLWKSEDFARDYVSSGAFDKNVELIQPLLEESSEWKIELSKDHTVQYTPVDDQIRVKAYPVASIDDYVPDGSDSKRSYLRILSLKINKGFEKEFTQIYNTEVLPALKAEKGCSHAFLVDNSEKKSEMISFSIWDDLNSVERYENDGKFISLLQKVDHTLGDLYQWKMALENRSRSKTAVTSQDLGVSKFTLVTGKNFNL